MDNMRSRFKDPREDERTVHEALRHAYQPPPKASRPSPPPPPEEPAPAPGPAAPPQSYYHKPKKTAWRKFALLTVILAALAGAGVYAYPKFIAPNPFPASIQHDANLSLLYPAKLPAGYQIDKTSFSLANDILIYTAASGDKKMVFTLQKTPSTFNFDSFYKQQLTGTQQFQTPYGQATVGKNNGHYLGSLPAGDTWLLVSTNSPAVNMDDMSIALQNLKKH
jgi:hypothetical protein